MLMVLLSLLIFPDLLNNKDINYGIRQIWPHKKIPLAGR